MGALKDLLNPQSTKAIAKELSRVFPRFAAKEFVRDASEGLRELELKARVTHIAAAMHKHLPRDPKKSFPLLVGAVEKGALNGFTAWPICYFVEAYGLDDPELGLDALRKITPHMSAEFAVRAFLLKHQAAALARITKWAQSSDVHVRRLASEGTRPRLPWGQRLPAFQKDPQLALPILRALRQDPELYVRKSVANHLNDFSKDHPEWLVEELRRWKEECSGDKNVEWIIRHATRTLVKAGHRETLELLGFGEATWAKAKLSVSPKKIRLGEAIKISFSAVPTASGPWVVDYAIHHRKAHGGTAPKVFKWAKLEAKKGAPVSLMKSHGVKKITTRKYYAGEQLVEVFVNGKSAGVKSWFLD